MKARKTKHQEREATKQVGLRVPESLLGQIDADAERLRREAGIVTLSRTDAALGLMKHGLEALEGKQRSR